MIAKAAACIAALGLLALPLMARPGNRGRSGEVYEVNATDVMLETNMAVDENMSMDLNMISNESVDCAPGDAICRRALKDMENAVAEAEAAVEAAVNAAEAAANVAEAAAEAAANAAGPEPRR